jgi:hypothetical protein
MDQTGRSAEREFAICWSQSPVGATSQHSGSIEDGTFSTCTNCDEAIGRNRLVAVPWTPLLCIRCQEAEAVDRSDTGMMALSCQLDSMLRELAANATDGGARMANHRSAAEKSPSESLTTERPHTCREKTYEARARKRIPAENLSTEPNDRLGDILWAVRPSAQFLSFVLMHTSASGRTSSA